MYKHWEGQFACGHDGCEFGEATTRRVIENHLRTAHSTTIYICDFANCGMPFKLVSAFQNHQRLHLGLKPYQCKWTDCGYTSSGSSNVLQHIRVIHFKLPETLKQQQAQGIVDNRNPREYLHVDTEMLKQIWQ